MATTIRANLYLEMKMTVQNEDYTITRPFTVADVHLATTTGAMGETVTVSRQALGAGMFNALSSAMACADSLGTLARSTLVAVAQKTLAITDVIRAAGSVATTRADVYVLVLPAAI
jgi:hypothetical protein